MNDTIVLHSPHSSPTHRRGGAWLLLIVASAIGASAIGTPAVMAQVAPPKAPSAAPSPAETLTILTEEPPVAKRTTIYYSRPAIKSPTTGQVRKIWGGLVPWDKTWRLGANQATLLISQSTLQFGTVTIPAGTPVTLYMLPVENGASKLIINKQIGQSGDQYDDKQDLGRVDLKKDALTETVERLILALDMNEDGAGGTLKIAWEDTQFSAPFTVKK